MSDQAVIDPARVGFDALLDALRQSGELARDPERGAHDASGRAAGYVYATELLRTALDLYVDGGEPRFVPLSSPTPYHAGRRMVYRVQGGLNPDALYDFAVLRPDRAYRVGGRRGNDCYLSFSFSGGRDGERPDRTVTTLNDRQMTFESDGSFEMIVSADEHDGNWVRMEPDVCSVIVRQYFVVPPEQRVPAELSIETLDSLPDARPDDPDAVAQRLSAAAAFIRSSNDTFPLPLGLADNAFMDPIGYSGEAGALGTTDNVYVMGRWRLDPSQALVVETTPVPGRYWSLQVWNHWGQSTTPTVEPDEYPRLIVNHENAELRADGSVRIVVADRDPGEPNWLDTFGWTEGTLIFRYLYPEARPAVPECQVVDLTSV
jgi:hypothetical protein